MVPISKNVEGLDVKNYSYLIVNGINAIYISNYLLSLNFKVNYKFNSIQVN
jgi:hypothetical protein